MPPASARLKPASSGAAGRVSRGYLSSTTRLVLAGCRRRRVTWPLFVEKWRPFPEFGIKTAFVLAVTLLRFVDAAD